jgi:hypothetical protein
VFPATTIVTMHEVVCNCQKANITHSLIQQSCCVEQTDWHDPIRAGRFERSYDNIVRIMRQILFVLLFFVYLTALLVLLHVLSFVI